MNAYHLALMRRLCIQRACDPRLPFFVTEWWAQRAERYLQSIRVAKVVSTGCGYANMPWIDWGSIGARQQLGIGPPPSGSMLAGAAALLGELV